MEKPCLKKQIRERKKKRRMRREKRKEKIERKRTRHTKTRKKEKSSAETTGHLLDYSFTVFFGSDKYVGVAQVQKEKSYLSSVQQ